MGTRSLRVRGYRFDSRENFFWIREKEKINEIRKISYNEEKVLINVDKKVITFEVE